MMRLYSTAPKACIRMVSDSRLHNLLSQLCQSVPITHVLETGTNIGLGSTAFIAKIFIGLSRAPQMFVTIEANHWCWRRAKKNLISFPFVTPFWGLSVSLRDALRFVKCDPVLQNHQDYPDIFIDDVDNPILFYTRELHGRLGGSTRHRISIVREFVDRYCSYAGENLLSQWLTRFRSQTPLIVLDSAGGVGYLEFNTVRQQMHDRPYFLLLDDIHHLKHFRSYRDVCNSDGFEVLGENRDSGWALAKYWPSDQGRF